MKVNLLSLSVLWSILLTQCVTPFSPEIAESADLLNIDGSLVKGREVQKIVVSKSTSLQEKTFYPVEDCIVYVTDDVGNRFDFSPGSKGIYTASIDDAFLNYNNSYQLHVITALGETYESTSETIYENQAIDTVYSIYETKYLINQGKELVGQQFYIDLKGSERTSRFYKWSIDETWEYVATYHIEEYFVRRESEIHPVYGEDRLSLLHCYDSVSRKGLYLSNTLNLEKNEKKKIPLHFVSRPSIKLSKKYCCLVHQHSLSEGAYNYWNQKKVELTESGGMYTRQPGQAITNIHNTKNPDETVLGYFWASAKTQRRFFYKGYYQKYSIDSCVLIPFKADDYPEIKDERQRDHTYRDTVYISYNPEEDRVTTSTICYDCREAGGTLKKPGYWDD